jgi:hypothetical protein
LSPSGTSFLLAPGFQSFDDFFPFFFDREQYEIYLVARNARDTWPNAAIICDWLVIVVSVHRFRESVRQNLKNNCDFEHFRDFDLQEAATRKEFLKELSRQKFQE